MDKDKVTMMEEIPPLQEQIDNKNSSIISMRDQLTERAKQREQSSKLFFDLEQRVSTQLQPIVSQLRQGEQCNQSYL